MREKEGKRRGEENFGGEEEGLGRVYGRVREEESLVEGGGGGQ